MEFIIEENLDNPSEQEKYFAELVDGEAKIYHLRLHGWNRRSRSHDVLDSREEALAEAAARV